MRKEKFIKQVIGSSLAFILCLTSLTGCGKKNTAVSLEEAKKIDKNCIFKQEEYEGIVEKKETVVILERVGDKIKAVTQTEKGKLRCVSFNPDGSDVQSYDIGPGKNCYVSCGAFDNAGNAYLQLSEVTGSLPSTLDASDTASKDDSTSEASEAASAEDSTSEASASEADDNSDVDGLVEAKEYLVKLDPSGKELFRQDFSQTDSKEGGEGGSPIYEMTWTEKCGLVCLTSSGLQTFDENSGLKMLIEQKTLGDSIYINSLVKVTDNKVLVTYYDEVNWEAGDQYVIIDLENNKPGKPLEGFNKNTQYNFFPGDETNLYVSADNGMFKYDMKSSKLVKILDFRDSSIGSGGSMTWIDAAAVSETEFVTSIPDDRTGSSTLVRLTKVKPEDVVDKTVLTLMTKCLDSNIGDAIMKFNRSNDKYSIKIIDYNEMYPDDWEMGEQQFNLDLTSGKAADIIDVSGNEASLRKYVDKGILLDLTSAFDNGGPLSDIELLPNIAEMMKVNGKMYTFMPSFNVQTCAVKAKYANGKNSLTFKEWDDLISSKGVSYSNAFGYYNNKNYLIDSIWLYYGDKFVDWKNKKCNFKDPEFIELLNFINRFPDEEEENRDDSGNFIDPDAFYVEDKALFYSSFMYNVNQYTRLKQLTFKDDIELIGFPNNSGENLAALNGTTFAVNSKTEHKDIIYDFIKSVLVEELDSWGGFSTIKSNFEAQLQDAGKEKSDDDDEAYEWDPVNEKRVKLKPLSQEEIQTLKDYILGIKTYACADVEVSKIVTEETQAFFAGQKSAEEVADIIQNRVNVYINENS